MIGDNTHVLTVFTLVLGDNKHVLSDNKHVLRGNTLMLRDNTCGTRGSKHIVRNTINVVRDKKHLLRGNPHVLKGSKQFLRDIKENFCSKKWGKTKKPMNKIHGLRYLHLLSDLLFEISLDMRFFSASRHLILIGVLAKFGCHSSENSF